MKNNISQDINKKTVSRKTAFGTMTTLGLAAIFLAAIIISVTNDMYAFVKKEKAITLNIDSPYSLEGFSRMLGDCDAINNPYVFMLYVKSKNKTPLVEGFVGELNINENMSYRDILLALS